MQQAESLQLARVLLHHHERVIVVLGDLRPGIVLRPERLDRAPQLGKSRVRRFHFRINGIGGIEAGAQDFEQGDDGEVVFLTEATDLDAVAKALPEFGYKVLTAKLVYRANNPVALGDAERAEVEAFLDAIDADDDVQNVYVGLAG